MIATEEKEPDKDLSTFLINCIAELDNRLKCILDDHTDENGLAKTTEMPIGYYQLMGQIIAYRNILNVFVYNEPSNLENTNET